MSSNKLLKSQDNILPGQAATSDTVKVERASLAETDNVPEEDIKHFVKESLDVFPQSSRSVVNIRFFKNEDLVLDFADTCEMLFSDARGEGLYSLAPLPVSLVDECQIAPDPSQYPVEERKIKSLKVFPEQTRILFIVID